ncbi:MAG: DJ-1/PfpI family protein [Oscillospiraceae bacterium]
MVYILLGTGFEEIEAISPCDILKRGGIPTSLVAVDNKNSVAGAHGISICADAPLNSISPKAGDTILIPGGMGGVDSIKASDAAMNFISSAKSAGAELAAICAGPSVLAKLGLINDRRITCYPGCESLMGTALCDCTKSTVQDGTLITGRAPGAAIDFGLALLAHIGGDKLAEQVRLELVY